MTAKTAAVVMALVALTGVLLSLYTELVKGIKPCLSCYILRYSYLSILLFSPFSLRYETISRFLTAVSIFIVAVSSWGLIGSLGYVPSPCIGTCNLPAALSVETGLFSLALIGGLIELISSLSLMKFRRS